MFEIERKNAFMILYYIGDVLLFYAVYSVRF